MEITFGRKVAARVRRCRVVVVRHRLPKSGPESDDPEDEAK